MGGGGGGGKFRCSVIFSELVSHRSGVTLWDFTKQFWNCLHRLRVMWFVTEGEVEKIDNFQLTLKSERGKKLLDVKLKKHQR